MHEKSLIAIFDQEHPLPVWVTAGDYAYQGWLVSLVLKRIKPGQTERALRAVVEDEHGRLFIHNARQLEQRKEPNAK